MCNEPDVICKKVCFKKISIEQKSNLLSNAVNDAIATLRAVESRTGIFIAITTFITGAEVEVFIKLLENLNILIESLVAVLILIGLTIIGGILVTLSYYYLLSSLCNSKKNIKNVNFKSRKYDNIWYIDCSKMDDVEVETEKNINKLNGLSEEEYIEVFEFELLKVSKIRDVKLEKLNKAYSYITGLVGIIFLKLIYLLVVFLKFPAN